MGDTRQVLRTCGCLTAVVLLLITAPAAQAFDSGPHADITVDSLRAEGFGQPAADVARVNNWFVDLYSQAEEVPYSGHSDPLTTLLAQGLFQRDERWPGHVTEAAAQSHFDQVPRRRLSNASELEVEWNGLRRTTYLAARDARDRNDPVGLLTVIGISLHKLQDFYSHTNWVEPSGVQGYDGPGWEQRGEGRTPTWFDVPRGIRQGARLYACCQSSSSRFHGTWRSDDNYWLQTAMAKDWPGRPLYAEAHQTAYFASRQLVRAIRTWVGNDVFWQRAQRYARRLSDLRHDVRGAFEISLYLGRWQGQGGPCTPLCNDTSGAGGSLVHSRSVVNRYFERGRTPFRRKFEQTISRMTGDRPLVPLEDVPVESSRELQRATAFVRLQVRSMRGLGLGDPGPDDADMYSRAVVAGQPYHSAVIHGRDRFSFPRPYYPFTWLRAVPRDGVYGEPVSSITVEVRTSSARNAGTDDDVSLRLGPNLSFRLDKALYNDFERGDRDTYSVPIDAATRQGLTVGDIRFVELAKSRDGLGGAWRLRGVTLRVNGRVVYSRDGIERWLEDNRRTWRAPNFVPSNPSGPALPVWLDLREDDYLYGDDDQGDVNEYDARNALARGYAPGTTVEQQITGGDRLGGRRGIGGDRATLRYRIDTIFPVLPPPPPPPTNEQPPPGEPPPSPPPPVPGGMPDLVITSLNHRDVTVRNQGSAAAGPFSLTVTHFYAWRVPGLAPGESATLTYGSQCGGSREAVADSDFEVAESDETNNRTTVDIIC